MADKKIVRCQHCGEACEIETYLDAEGDCFRVICSSLDACGYQGPIKASRDMAVTTHNRVSNASATQPDLLEAMGELLALWQCDPDDSAERDIVEAAIRKAKGESDGK